MNNKTFIITLFIGLFLVAFLMIVVLFFVPAAEESKAPVVVREQPSASVPQAPPVTLSLSTFRQPQVGQEFEVALNLDTAGLEVDGVDVGLEYEPQLLEFVPDSVEGSEHFPQVLGVRVSGETDAAGSLRFSALTDFGQRYQGLGEVARLTFKALAAEETIVSLLASAGNTTDTNVSSRGEDVLQYTESLELEIK